jgi:hypothetical protein
MGSQTCIECHTSAADNWRRSHHANAWTKATSENIRGDFNGSEFNLRGMSAKFRVDADGVHRVVVEEFDGTTMDYPIHSVVGIEPLQQYLLETAPGRLQSFDVVWDTGKGGWFHLYPDDDLPPSDSLHWTGPYKNWNSRCAECHATGSEKGYDLSSRQYTSTQAEIGVGCEACHGPGESHLDWARAGAASNPPPNYGFAVDFTDTHVAIQQCATCHSRREAHLDSSPMPGTPFDDSYNLSLLRLGLYYADGQIRDEVFVYGSFLQSKMYARGVGCMDCHGPHTGERLAEGNAVCTQCHNPAGRPDFPSLKPAAYDSPAHHFHEVGSEGAQCQSCHMVERVYMGNDWRADHSFRIPRPDLSSETGAPDACTGCHTDRGHEWAAAQIEAWYPQSDNRGRHYGQTLAFGHRDPVAAGDELAALALDETQPGIARATALWLLQQSNSPEIATRLAPLLTDADPVVRAAAVGVQRTANPQDWAMRLIEVLDDPRRNVRIATAQALIGSPIARLPAPYDAQLQSAMTEWRQSLAGRMDFPETHLQVAGAALTMRRFPAAMQAFGEVVKLDPQRIDAWAMLVRIGAALGHGERSLRETLARGLAANPNNPVLLGLLEELNREIPALEEEVPGQAGSTIEGGSG